MVFCIACYIPCWDTYPTGVLVDSLHLHDTSSVSLVLALALHIKHRYCIIEHYNIIHCLYPVLSSSLQFHSP